MARPEPDCICRMKNTQTAINSSIGNQFSMTLMMDGTSSSEGLALNLTSFLRKRSTSPGSSGAYVVKLPPLSRSVP